MFYISMICGCVAIAMCFSAIYFGIFMKQVIPFMLCAFIGLVLLVLGYNTSPYKNEEDDY